MKRPITITLEEEIIEEIKAKADADSRTVSNYIEVILKKELTEGQ